MEFHAAWRVSGFHYPPLIDHNNFADTFYDRHPEWRGEDRQGRRTPIMAYTYEGVRQFAVSLFREMANYPIDGVCPLFNRRLPLVEYEPPLVEGFMREFGADPRELDERDPTWLAYRSRVLTQFMRELRQAMGRREPRAGAVHADCGVGDRRRHRGPPTPSSAAISRPGPRKAWWTH